ncbi:MAG TPA: hypothetical protein VNW52_11975 [Burkholderiaceae bacterium]|jgi:hypothetical protein|nr:hypothetical protein [Burkholderiaceae bacterium]
MSKLRNAVAGALSFAHLGGRSFNATKADDKKPDENANENDKPKEGRRAQGENESDEDYAEYNDREDEKDEKDEEARRAKAEEEEADEDKDDDEDEMRGKSAASQARRRERARCATIMGSKFAARNLVLAANLAFNTTMTRSQALAVLKDTPAATAPHQGRSAGNPSLGAGGGELANSKAAIDSSWDRAMKKVTPSRK